MDILVINCGSSSLKYQVLNSDTEEVLAKGICERIGISGVLKYTPKGGETEVSELDMPTHTEAVKYVLDALTNEKTGVLKSLDQIDAVGHRIVHGGEHFSEATLITEDVIKAVEDCNDLAPLHNPANIIGIRACQAVMPNVPMVGIFDTAFHATMPKKAFLYGIPYEYYEKDKLRRYGFHGTSHSFVSKRAAELIGKPYDQCKTVVCHLGNGASICAVENGKSIDTSMGLSPLEGLIMGTRSGDIDPSVIQYIANHYNKTLDEVVEILNKKSGVDGLSGVSSDFRDITKEMEEGNERAKAAMDAYCYRVAKYVGSYITAMHGVDVVVFTAGIGENNSYVRRYVMEYFDFMGVKEDKEANSVMHIGEDTKMTTDDSKIPFYVIPTDEELSICRQTVEVLKNA
ncbi:MAG: acetate kinase [Lachnospiraceae bacterium]|nr:acetate kinase [Lachnospiraceae bacterium]